MRNAFGIATVALAAALLVSPAMAHAGTEPAPYIDVSGSGTVSGRPDTAQIGIGVTSEDASATRALQANSRDMQRVLAVLKAHGIAGNDMQTHGFSVAPYYRPEKQGEPPRLAGYRVTNRVAATVRKLDDLGTLLDALVKGGANTIDGISFGVTEPAALFDEARREAVADARRRATLYAAAAKVKLGEIVYIQEQRATTPRPMQVGMAMLQTREAVPVATGELEFRVDIAVRFAIRPR